MRVTVAVPAATAVAQALDVKQSVRVVTTAALASYARVGNVITASANGALAAIDGVTLIAGNRLLLKDGAAGADNGIYDVTTVGDVSTKFVLTRSADADASSKVTTGIFVFVEEGTIYASTSWVLTTANPITLNTTALTFKQFGVAGGIPAAALGAKSPELNAMAGRILIYVKDLTLLTSATPADILAIDISKLGLTAWRAVGSSALADPFVTMVAGATWGGTQAAATFRIQDASGGGGSTLSTNDFTGIGSNSASVSAGAAASNNTRSTSTTIYIRQTAATANAGSCSFYIVIEPLP